MHFWKDGTEEAAFCLVPSICLVFVKLSILNDSVIDIWEVCMALAILLSSSVYISKIISAIWHGQFLIWLNQ